MPEDSKKNEKKSAKEQRKPRQRHQQGKAEKRSEKTEEPKEEKSTPKVAVPQKPPVYESPPPEFYKNLKRETDEILKITEEESSKYKKKEIQSNWSKYEVPIESYDEIDEQENLGADYEKLIEAPLSLGGHFQFKHEKSWDMNTGPSQYDKYFEINMEDLNTALCTIPFYERNQIEQANFSETDILTMNNRSTRFKQKYFNDKSYSTPETEAQDKILNSLRDNLKNEDKTTANTEIYSKDIQIKADNDVKTTKLCEGRPSLSTDINLELKDEPVAFDSNKIIEENILNSNKLSEKTEPTTSSNEKSLDSTKEHDDFIFVKTEIPTKSELVTPEVSNPKVSDDKEEPQVEIKKTAAVLETKAAAIENKITPAPAIVAATLAETKKNPVIESPEDLEKWLDDFLDG